MRTRSFIATYQIARHALAVSLLLAGSSLVAYAEDAAVSAAVSDVYVDTLSAASTTSGTFVPVPGLTFTLPAASTGQSFAILTLNMPSTYLSGTPTAGTPLGGEVAIYSGTTQVCMAEVSNEVPGPSESPRHNATLVVKVSLVSTTQTITAQWRTVRGGTLLSDVFSSMSAILTAN